jgi:mxaK protein
MNGPVRSRPSASRGRHIRTLRRKAGAWAPVVALILSGLVALGCFAWLCVSVYDNRTIARLASGHEIQVGARAAPAVIFARAKFLMDRDEFEQSQPLVESVVRSGTVEAATHILYDAGNARLHHAIRLIEDNKFDAASADVVLARDFYTRALRLDPQFWDAKYNLDIAMRLVRDLPEVDIPGEDVKQPTNKLWTDLPGLPKGGP